MGIKDLERLETWRKSMDFCLRVYREVLPLLPPQEKWALDQQIRRAAVNIPAKIAEGHGRYYYQDNVRFCYNARGSLEELLSHLAIAYEMDFMSESLFDSLEGDGRKLAQLINGTIAFLKRSKQGHDEPGSDHAAREMPAPYDYDPDEFSDGPIPPPNPE